MKAKIALVALFFIIFAANTLAQIGVSAEVQGTPFDGVVKKFSTWTLQAKYGLTDNLSIMGTFRSSRSRPWSVTEPNKSPVDGGTVGIAFRVNPTLGIAASAGLMNRKNPGDPNEVGWLAAVDVFLGYTTASNYYLKKQVYIYGRFEKGQWYDFYADVRGIYPMLDFVAVGARYESDLGWGPHLEIKIPLAEPEVQKNIYLFCTHYADNKTTVLGARITLN